VRVVELERIEEAELTEQGIGTSRIVEKHSQSEGDPLRLGLVATVEGGGGFPDEADLGSEVGQQLMALLRRPLHGTTVPAFRRYPVGEMGLLGEPENEVYRLTKSGTLALLDAVDEVDTKGASALASKEQPCEAVSAYLDASFLGAFLRSGHRIPYAENAGVLGTYIDFLDHELAMGATHVTSLHQTHLKLLAYVVAIEAEAPLTLFGNGLEFLGGRRHDFKLGIYHAQSSAHAKVRALGLAIAKAPSVPAPFQRLYQRLSRLIDRDLRNAIAHATYRVHAEGQSVDFWNKGTLEASRTSEQVERMYRDARSYQQGFVAAVSEFCQGIHPACPYYWHP
jgi:hypothetical protein